jgi:hypothetical protein
MNLSNPKNSPDSINLSGYLRAIPSVDAPKSARSSGAYLGLQVVESSTTFGLTKSQLPKKSAVFTEQQIVRRKTCQQ